MAATKGSKEINALKEFVEEKKGELELLQYSDMLATFITDGINGNCDYSYSPSAKMFSFILEVSGTGYEGRSDRIEKISKGDTVSIVRDPDNQYDSKCLAVHNVKGESLGNLNGEAATVISPVIDKAGYKINNAKVASVVHKSDKGPRAKKADLYVSFDLSLEKSQKTTTKTNKSTKPKTAGKAGDLISDFDYIDTRFRGPGKEIDKLTAYIDKNLEEVKRIPYMRQEVVDGIDEVLIKGGPILKDTPDLVKRFPLLKATGIYENSSYWAVGVWFSDSGSPYPTQMDRAGGFDPKADGGEGRWAWENDMMDNVECTIEYIQTGDEEEVSYSYPYEDLWNATDDYTSAPDGDEPTDDPSNEEKIENKPKAKTGTKGDYIYDWTFEEGNTIRGEDFEIAVPDGFVGERNVVDNEGFMKFKRAFIIKPKDSSKTMTLLCGQKQEQEVGHWMVHPQANAGVYGLYSSLLMEQMINVLNLDVESASVIGWSDTAASVQVQDTGNMTRSYQITVYMDEFFQQLRVQTGRLTKPKKKMLSASINRWLHTMKFDKKNAQKPDTPKIDNPKIITELSAGKTKLFEEAVEEAVTEYGIAVKGRYKILDAMAQNGKLASYSSDDLRQMLLDAMEVKEYYCNKIDEVLSSPKLENMDQKTMDKVRECLEPLFTEDNDATEIKIDGKKTTIDLPESVVAFREKYGKTNSKKKSSDSKIKDESRESKVPAKKAKTNSRSKQTELSIQQQKEEEKKREEEERLEEQRRKEQEEIERKQRLEKLKVELPKRRKYLELASNMIGGVYSRFAHVNADGTVTSYYDGYGDYQSDTSAFRNIIGVVCSSDAVVGLRNDGTCIASPVDKYCHSHVKECNSWRDIVSLSAGEHHIVGITKGGRCIANTVKWNTLYGYNDQCNVSSWTDVVKVVCGNYYTIGIRSDGHVLLAGNGTFLKVKDVRNWENIDLIATSVNGLYDNGAIGLTKDGKFVTCGDYRQLLEDIKKTSYDGLDPAKGIVQLEMDENLTYALYMDGTVGSCAGTNRFGKPAYQVKETNVVAIRVIGHALYVLTEDGRIVVYGSKNEKMPDNIKLFDSYDKLMGKQNKKKEWIHKGVCQYCGGAFKKGLFGYKCTMCGKKKDYL